MIKGYRMQGTSESSAPAKTGTVNSAVQLLAVPTGKTFIMTDLVVAFTPLTNCTGVAPPGAAIYDSATTAGTVLVFSDSIKAVIRKERPIALESTDGVRSGCAESVVLTDIVNGIEFSTAVSVASVCSYAIPTYGAFVGGIVR